MPETIESFVAKLQADGVEAGKAEAEKLLADAQAHADRIIGSIRHECLYHVIVSNERNLQFSPPRRAASRPISG